MNNELHLILCGVWFDRVLCGDKRVEYRRITPRWTKQIWERRPVGLVLHRGYTRNVIRAEITLIDTGPCPYKGWEGDYYRVHFTPRVRRMVGKAVTAADGREVVKVGGLEIPVIGYVNCTGHPLSGDAENAAGIRRFTDGQSTPKDNITEL